MTGPAAPRRRPPGTRAGGQFAPIDRSETSPPGPADTSAPQAWDRRRTYTPQDSADFGAHLAATHGVTMWLGARPGADAYVTLSHLEVPPEKRGAGVGTAAIQDLIDEADRNGWTLDLSPSGEFGGAITRLRRFYKGFGFVENRGRHKDYRTRETFLRHPH